MSPSRRLLLLSLGVVVAVVAGVALLAALLRADPREVVAVPQEVAGPVLLVPGYGGNTSSLEGLATALRAAGRDATVLSLPGDGTGDLAGSAAVLAAAADAAIGRGAPSVDVIGYSAGGVVARLWAADGGAEQARRVVTLGSPHHGTSIAGFATALLPGACPAACQQLAPGSDLLETLNDGDETPDGPLWLSLWTAVDEIVTPPESASLEGATNVVLQDLCPGSTTPHGVLPVDPAVQAVVLDALSTAPLTPPVGCVSS